MKTIVITGGTDGIGRALAQTYLDRGDTVVVIGRDATKALGTHFIQADLSLIRDNERVIAEIQAKFPMVDALVFCARHFRSRRRETPEGIEENFALFYLSRYLLGHGLLPLLENADSPIIMNVAGPGGDPSLIHWNDLEFSHGYDGSAALAQGGPLNDLLGVAFAGQAESIRTRYVLFHPGMTATGLSGEYDAAIEAHIRWMKKHGKSVADAIAPIVPLIDTPPGEPLSAFVEGRRISVAEGSGSFNAAAAARLHEVTRKLLP